MGSFAEGIRGGRLEVNPHLTPEERKSFDEMVAFLDPVTAKATAQIQVERRTLIDAGRMTEDGVLIDPPDLSGEGRWLMEWERETFPETAPKNRVSPDAQLQIDRMLRGLNNYVHED